MLLVLWALGWAMIALSVLVRFPVIVADDLRRRAGVGAQSARLHHSRRIRCGRFCTRRASCSTLLHTSCSWPIRSFRGSASRRWDFHSGRSIRGSANRRRAFCCALGIALSAAFVALRAINVYGDPVRWSAQKSALFTVLSFLEHDQVSAVAAVPADDARPRAHLSLGGRWRHASRARARAHHRQGADVLLCAPLRTDPSPRGRDLSRALPRRALDVRVARPRPLSDSRRRRGGDSRYRSCIWCGRSS